MKWRLRFLLLVIVSWFIWFSGKVALDRVSESGQNAYNEMAGRISTASNSSLSLLFQTSALFRALGLAILHWCYVVVPFVHDLTYISTTYVEPFLRVRVILPLCALLYPVPMVLSHYASRGFFWLIQNVGLEYQISSLLAVIIIATKRLDPVVKTHLILCATLLFLNSYLRNLLNNKKMELFSFVLVPTIIALHAVTSKTGNSNRIANMMIYFILFPFAVASMPFLQKFHPILNLTCTSLAYSSLISMLYWRDTRYLSEHFSKLTRSVSTISFPALWLRDKFVQPMKANISSIVKDRFPRLAVIFNKLSDLADISSINVLTVTLLSGNTGFTNKLLTILKSVTVLKLILFATVVLAVAVYVLHVALTKLILYAVWPWWFHGAVKTVLFKRTEDFQGELSFTLLFLALEYSISSCSTELLCFLLSFLHVPLLLIFRVAPSVSVKGITNTVLFIPLFLMTTLYSKRSGTISSSFKKDTSAEKSTRQSLSPTEKVKPRRKSISNS